MPLFNVGFVIFPHLIQLDLPARTGSRGSARVGNAHRGEISSPVSAVAGFAPISNGAGAASSPGEHYPQQTPRRR